MRIVAAILAAGKGERFGGDKVSQHVGGKPLWRWSFDMLSTHPLVDGVGLVFSRENLVSCPEAEFVIVGGSNRQESSRLAIIAAEGDIVLLQDAARPFTSAAVVTRVIEAVSRTGAAAPAVPVADTLRTKSPDGYVLTNRNETVAMQTPQGGTRDILLQAHNHSTLVHTDEMALVEAIGIRFEIVEGDQRGFKITTSHDLARARAMVEGVEIRTGIGYDIHAFSTDSTRPLMLGGVRFEGCPGLDGHSDADVVIHAAVDALLGAAAQGDIGTHFPNTDPRWHGEPSMTFLKHAGTTLAGLGWMIVNLDITMIGEKPKVMPHSLEVRTALAHGLGIETSRVSFKATTNEGLGSLGRGEGIAAYAVATIRELQVSIPQD